MNCLPALSRMGSIVHLTASVAFFINLLVASGERLRHARTENGTFERASRKILQEATSKRSGLVVGNIGIFSGTHVEKAFYGANFWDRHCEHTQVGHHTGDGGVVYSAVYNHCAGVSDLVYYKVKAQAFKSGNGRGGGWKDDPQLRGQFRTAGQKRSEYASASDYSGCGFFNLDRGHQAPVASFNAEHADASLTNMPTNLSPQFAYLNQKSWQYFEIDMRKKAEQVVKNDPDTAVEVEMITGPLYQLPRALVENINGNAMWSKLLDTGGIQITNNTVSNAWCPVGKMDGSFMSEVLLNSKGSSRSEHMKCEVADDSYMPKASTDPNKLRISYNRGRTSSFPIRTPLGYYKLMVMKAGGRLGRRTCAVIMDQVGQCLLVSVELLSKMTHLDFQDTEWASKGGLVVQNASSTAEYNAYVNPYWCIPPGGTLRNKNSCLFATNKVTDPEDVTIRLMEMYWRKRLETETDKKDDIGLLRKRTLSARSPLVDDLPEPLPAKRIKVA